MSLSTTAAAASPQRRSLRPKKARKPTARAAEAAAMNDYECVEPMPRQQRRKVSTSSSTSSAVSNTEIKKPMRPLTAYHIFFQIEREYIIQTTAGPDADKSIHSKKSYQQDVPRRYRDIKLLPDWYAGPGKRQKRKHRKSHGKIGFLELSRVISKRWATLDTSDPETKQYVARIAARELDEYKVEMIEWKEMVGDDAEEDEKAAPPVRRTKRASSGKRKSSRKKTVSPDASPTSSPRAYDAAMLRQLYQQDRQQPVEKVPPMPVVPQLTISAPVAPQVDYSICKVNNGHFHPSPTGGADESSFDESSHHSDEYDPLFELDNNDPLLQLHQVRSVSPVNSSMATAV